MEWEESALGMYYTKIKHNIDNIKILLSISIIDFGSLGVSNIIQPMLDFNNEYIKLYSTTNSFPVLHSNIDLQIVYIRDKI